MEIGPVRPMFAENEVNPKKRVERIQMGTKHSGIIIDVTRSGIEISGYYTGFTKESKYSNLREPVYIAWDDLEKVKKKVFKPVPKDGQILPDYSEDETDESYLESLPVVTINGFKYYIDSSKKERRSVDRPKEVFKY